MPITLKKSKAPKPVAAVLMGVDGCERTPLVSGLDLTNRTTRTAVGWITDASPSMEGFTHSQLESAKSMVEELRSMPLTARSVMMNIVQLGSPAAATGFQEIATFAVPPLHLATSTPLHAALELMTAGLGGLCSDLRSHGIERTDSIVIITTDGFANDTTPEALAKSIDDFLAVGRKWSVTNLVVGVGSKLNEPLLRKLAPTVPPLQVKDLNAAKLMPFIQNIAQKVSASKRGQTVEVELTEGITPLGE